MRTSLVQQSRNSHGFVVASQARTSSGPILSLMEERVLKQISFWQDDYEENIQEGSRRDLAWQYVPTTQKCAEYFRYIHGEMLTLLNNLEIYGYVIKARRLSAGLHGNGFDGALHSSVFLTEAGKKAAACL